MLFKQDLIEKIVSEEKTQTRRLVTDKHSAFTNGKIVIEYWNDKRFEYPKNCKSRIKWEVGKDYSVQPGRGAKGVLWCSKCKETNLQTDYTTHFCDLKKTWYFENLRIRITSIEKQRLLDITRDEVEKEGFKHEINFYGYFLRVTKKHQPLSLQKANELNVLYEVRKWNPFVWVISFEKVV